MVRSTRSRGTPEKEDDLTGLLSITSMTSNDGETCNNLKSDEYPNQFVEVVRELYNEESMLDVTLCASGHKFRAHRMVLGSCSSLFQELLSHTNEEQTIFIPEVNPEHLQAIVLFCYNGEIRVPSTEISELLALAQYLKIEGLREVAGMVESSDSSNNQDGDEDSYILQEFAVEDEEEDETEPFADVSSSPYNSPKKNIENNSNTNRPIRRRKSVSKKEYSEEQLAAAIEDIRAGSSLLDASIKHSVPRSTLYMRTKSLGIKINPTRFVYTIDDMKRAIKAVADGCSLQRASDIHGIPKTVLWRRIQKEGVQVPKRDRRKTYGNDKRQAAVKALERGEALSKVASEFDIPKTTLFRDKARLINQGKLPTTFLRKRKFEGENQKQSRLDEAVAACKDGKMSQAAASATYQIPKTTIWRRLHRANKREQTSREAIPSHIKTRRRIPRELAKEKIDSSIVKAEELNEDEFEPYCPDETEMNITYINEENIGIDPVIILANEDGEEMNLSNRQNLVVVHGGTSDDTYISCEIENYGKNSLPQKS